MKIFVLNSGSSSIKYQLFDTASSKALHAGKAEIGDQKEYESTIRNILDSVKDDIDAFGHRIVHGGSSFRAATLLNDSAIEKIAENNSLAPLHNPANLLGVKIARELCPDLPHVAVFDTAFHSTLPRRATTYSLPEHVREELGARRYGFHGTSHAYVATRVASHLARPLNELRVCTLHLGNGASACAIEMGHSVETSMGFTPLEGLVMGSRCGDTDPGIVLEMVRKYGVDETERLLNHESGLKGISGISNDLRELQKAAREGHDGARLSLNVFAHGARKYLGAYMAMMGGMDAVAFMGGIGENSPGMRRRIVQRLDHMGIVFDEDLNQDVNVKRGTDNDIAAIHAENSRIKVFVVATDEEKQIAIESEHVIRNSKKVINPGPVPIAVSARHVHLTREAMDALFGEGSELSELRPLSQPGQFASEQKVALVGPRGRIDGVRILGPLRPKCQVEVSRTDEFHLGVDAPVRRSGQVKGSAPITLEGPNGKLHLKEGLICAWRHIHMTSADAERFGVRDGDEVEVAIKNGVRDLTFGDVLVRVKDSYALEMHIDTDEANAAELSRSGNGDLVYTPAPENVEGAIGGKNIRH